MFRLKHDVQTGKVEEIELSAAELKELETLYDISKKNESALNVELKKIQDQKDALLAKLGITADEAKLLLG
jgi:flagellar biosynthesis chaperone FliJ